MTDQSSTLDGAVVAAFESRRADDTARLIERFGGRAQVSPSMRELPLDNNRAAIDFANLVITGQVDAVVFLTGVGTSALVDAVARHVDQSQLLDALRDTTTVARGPKPLSVLRKLGVEPNAVAPEPNTWREVLAVFDERLPPANLTVAVQEYGAPNVSLVAGLEARGATVLRVPVYRWALPEDTGPLEENVRLIARGEADAIVFTSAQQVVHVLQIASQLGVEETLRCGFDNAVVASVGPTTSEMLRAQHLPVDFEPSHPKLGHLVSELADRYAELIERKRSPRARVTAPPAQQDGPAPAWHDSPFMRACRREPVPHTPVWLMRQAGRYMAEYREVRAGRSFLELCRDPALCSEVMCTAVEKLGVDAAIIFSDLLPILEPMGLELEFVAGDGPTIHNPVREGGDVDRVAELEDVDALHYVYETVAQTRRDLPEAIPLIGFAGAPFTLASYTIEGGASRNFLHTKTLMYREPAAWDELMGRLTRSIARYLNAQIAAGAQAVQLFDSWVGCLSAGDYARHVLPHVRQLVALLDPGVPLIHFGTGNPALLPLMAEAGSVIGVDWRISLDNAWRSIGYDKAIQGNLDPAVLLGDRDLIRNRAAEVLRQAGSRPGHIFNLGHGVLQQTPVDNARALVEAVHELSAR